MLKALITFGITEKYFEIKKIGDFTNAKDQGINHINTKAIDFDNTKNIVQKELKLQCFKSCDALDIICAKNKLNFIEFKQIKDRVEIENFIKDELELPQKIKDSREVILNIIRKPRFNHADRIHEFNNYEKNFIIAFELTQSKIIKTGLFMRLLTVREIMLKQFKNNYIQGEKYNEPVCMGLTDFDTAYLKYA